MLTARGTSAEEVLAGASSQGLRMLLAALREKAEAACAEAIERVAGLEHAARAAFLPLRLVHPYLAALEALDRRGADPLRQVADINPLYRFWRLASWRK
jgi:phytoene synthase